MDNSLSLFPFTSLSHFLRLPRRLFIIYLLIGPAMGIGKSHMKYSFERLNRKYVALPQANFAPPPPPSPKTKQKQTNESIFPEFMRKGKLHRCPKKSVAYSISYSCASRT